MSVTALRGRRRLHDLCRQQDEGVVMTIEPVGTDIGCVADLVPLPARCVTCDAPSFTATAAHRPAWQWSGDLGLRALDLRGVTKPLSRMAGRWAPQFFPLRPYAGRNSECRCPSKPMCSEANVYRDGPSEIDDP
jgi:hypothetical protein